MICSMSAPQIILGPNNHKLGTCEIDKTFGTVKSAELDESVSEHEFEDCCGDAAAVLLNKHKYTLSLTILWTAGAAVPNIGQQINFPAAGITGNITNKVISWENGGDKMMKLKASHWVSIGNAVPMVIDCN
jgi:hypothetical protein